MASYKTVGYKISDIYQGGYSSLTPPQTDTFGGYMPAGKIGLAIDFRTANILQEVSTKLSTGTKQIEVAPIQPEVFDAIPKQQLKEVHRLSKLTGIDVSMHGPLIEASGIGQQGFNETERELAERKITEALLRSHELNPDGNIPVTFHSTVGVPGSQFLPPSQRKEGKEYKKLLVVSREDGRIRALEPETEFHAGGEVTEVTKTPEQRLSSLNNTEWKNSLFQVEINRENAERIMRDIHPIFMSRFVQLQSGQIKPEELSDDEKVQLNKVYSAFQFVDQARQSANSLFSRAYELAKKDNDGEKIALLESFSKRYGKTVGIEGEKITNPEKYLNPKVHTEALRELTQIMDQVPPKTWVPVEQFAAEKSSESFGRAAFEAYKKFKDKAPLLVIENPPAGGGLSTSEGIKAVVEKSREKFVEAAKKEGLSESEAKKQAEKLIGVTWDVGHINMLRGQGYSEEEIIKETEKVAPYVKHVHLSDNFGMEHTELPMGMGNVPLKEMLAKLGQKGFEAKKIIEAGHWWQHFKTPPFQETLEATGSPIYSMKMGPYWAQAAGLYQGYLSGFPGQWLPQINYETFGAGFSRLPNELGGTAPGAQGGRMSGRPME